jgi:nitroreductase
VDAIEALLTRRSIRTYTDQPVPGETVRQLLEIAMAAPSAGNQQPWHFIVIDDRAVLDRIPDIQPYAAMCRQAPVAIVVAAQPALETKYTGYWPLDCAAATQNILVGAKAMGLGAVWCGIYPVPERVAGLRGLLGLPEGVIPVSLVPIGHPAETKGPAGRYDDGRVHSNRW